MDIQLVSYNSFFIGIINLLDTIYINVWNINCNRTQRTYGYEIAF